MFPDLQQILDNNTNADTGACPTGADRAAGPDPGQGVLLGVPADGRRTSASRRRHDAVPRLTDSFTARDGKGGSTCADEMVLTSPRPPGPFLSPRRTRPWLVAASTQTITWNVAGTDPAPINAANVKITLSTDGGYTYPTVLAASTPNDGSEALTMPNVDDDARPA